MPTAAAKVAELRSKYPQLYIEVRCQWQSTLCLSVHEWGRGRDKSGSFVGQGLSMQGLEAARHLLPQLQRDLWQFLME